MLHPLQKFARLYVGSIIVDKLECEKFVKSVNRFTCFISLWKSQFSDSLDVYVNLRANATDVYRASDEWLEHRLRKTTDYIRMDVRVQFVRIAVG
jgi:hypothetical protein